MTVGTPRHQNGGNLVLDSALRMKDDVNVSGIHVTVTDT